MQKRKLVRTSNTVVEKLFGPFDENIDIIRKETNVAIREADDGIVLFGEEKSVLLCERILKNLIGLIGEGQLIDKGKVKYIVDLAKDGNDEEITKKLNGVIAVTYRGKQIRPKTYGQSHYVKAIKNNHVVFGIGPAGTGKTYLAVAMAVVAFKAKEVEKIILTRPAVEAGEKLGFLPGDLQEKIDPYLRPLYDALEEMFGLEQYQKLMERGVIEIAPLAYMRGRTLSNAFVILDEAQNTTREQMKMFLTRLGEGSRMIVTGDVTQIDLPRGKSSGLMHASKILNDIDDIAVHRFSHKDVVRHDLVMNIVKAYEKYDDEREEARGSKVIDSEANK